MKGRRWCGDAHRGRARDVAGTRADLESWTLSPSELKVQTPSIGTYGACEPVVIERENGSVWMLMRTQVGASTSPSQLTGRSGVILDRRG